MDQSGKAHAGDVAGVRIKSGNIPDRFLRQREVVGEKAAAILFGKESVEAPRALRENADVENIDDQKVARLGAMHTDRSGEKVNDAEIDIADIIGGIVVLDEAAGPVIGLHHEIFAGLHPLDDRDIRMPAVVNELVLVGRFLEVNLDDCFGHVRSSRSTWHHSNRHTLCKAHTAR
jgi:hypothetical protein